MKDNWLWDRKITDSAAKNILKNPASKDFFVVAALLLSRKNTPREIFKIYLDPLVFCKYWSSIKRRMRQDKWNEQRIVFWQAIYEKLSDRYRKKGMTFRQEAPSREPLLRSIGEKIAQIRRSGGLSQKAVAKKIRVSQQLISRIEKGRENMSLITLNNIARALNRKVDINLEKY